MKTKTSVRVFSPFQNRRIDATPAQARILRQVHKTLEFYAAAAQDRARLAQAEWKDKALASILVDLEMLDEAVAGAASWCRSGSRHHPDPDAVQGMLSFDITRMSQQVTAYPHLRRHLESIAKLRELVIQYFREQKAA